ncbi:hypothetical protein CBER1_10680 [Cercospora berteroae]|uniref:FAD-binding PCMH-type domain-containing protein n=1 Tax=Cercospora berteroae TaxID=357750 RepID=A0A2S6CJN3_9PEZI|nr:hypothetical protein CBER1_10680 [Cercospora berteroae]
MQLLRSYLALLPVLLSPAFALINADNCKCLPKDECWPKDEAWSQLSSTINGRLIRSKPPASVCYPEESNYDPEACSRVFDNWESSYWHADDPISIDAPPRYACHPIYPNGTSIYGDPIAGEKYVSDVQAGVDFARRYSVKLNVKNTGHGRSSIPGSLSIWTHYFKKKEFHTNFVPQGANCSINRTSMAVTFGAGFFDREAFEFAAEHDAVVVGGTDSTVGLVGCAGAGGHGYLTGAYGMGADSFLEVTVVPPSGDIVVANEFQNADLFWAIGGGGAGTWGVVVSLTVKAHPMPSTAMWSLSLTAQNGTTASEWYKVAAEKRRLEFHERNHRRDLDENIRQNPSGLWKHFRLRVRNITSRYVGTDNPIAVFKVDLHELWDLLVQAAKLTPTNDAAADRLVAQVLFARNLGQVRCLVPPADARSQQQANPARIEHAITSSNASMWTDLPFLATDLQRFWTECLVIWNVVERSNVAGICGRLSAAGVCGSSITSLALILFREALETQEDREKTSPPHTTEDSPSRLADYLPAVLAWIQAGSYQLLDLCMHDHVPSVDIPHDEVDWRVGGPLTADVNSNGKPMLGFSMPRWRFWKDRLEYFRNMCKDQDMIEQSTTSVNSMNEWEVLTGGFGGVLERERTHTAYFLGVVDE